MGVSFVTVLSAGDVLGCIGADLRGGFGGVVGAGVQVLCEMSRWARCEGLFTAYVAAKARRDIAMVLFLSWACDVTGKTKNKRTVCPSECDVN